MLLLHDAGVTVGDWSPWVGLLDEQGYDSEAVRWPRELGTMGRHSLRELARAAAEMVDAQARAPVVLGHGIGGAIAHMLTVRCAPAAVISIAPVPVGPRALWTPAPTGPSPLRVPRRHLLAAPLARAANRRPPVLLISGGADRIAPERAVEARKRRNRRRHPEAVSDHQVFPGRGHDLVRDAKWADVAWYCVEWLIRQGL